MQDDFFQPHDNGDLFIEAEQLLSVKKPKSFLPDRIKIVFFSIISMCLGPYLIYYFYHSHGALHRIGLDGAQEVILPTGLISFCFILFFAGLVMFIMSILITIIDLTARITVNEIEIRKHGVFAANVSWQSVGYFTYDDSKARSTALETLIEIIGSLTIIGFTSTHNANKAPERKFGMASAPVIGNDVSGLWKKRQMIWFSGQKDKMQQVVAQLNACRDEARRLRNQP